VKLTVDRNTFLTAAESSKRTVKQKSGQVLESTFLRAVSGKLEIAATDIVIRTQSWIPAAILSPGSVCVNASALVDAVGAMPRGALEIEANDVYRVAFRGGRRSMEVNGIGWDSYPSLPDVPTTWTTLPAAPLRDLLRRTEFAASTDPTRPSFAGVKIEVENGCLTAIATDGQRLAYAQGTAIDKPINILIPSRVAREILKVLGSIEAATVDFCVQRENLFLRAGDSILSGVMHDPTTFPEWRQVLPEKSASRARAARSTLLEGVSAVVKIAGDKTSGIAVTLRPGEVELQSIDPERGAGKDVIDAELDGPEMKVGLSGIFLSDALASSDDEDVLIEANGEVDPVIVRPADIAGQFCLLMPRRL